MASEDRYDAIVIGLGGMGSATLRELARRGKRALGIEQFVGWRTIWVRRTG